MAVAVVYLLRSTTALLNFRSNLPNHFRGGMSIILTAGDINSSGSAVTSALVSTTTSSLNQPSPAESSRLAAPSS